MSRYIKTLVLSVLAVAVAGTTMAAAPAAQATQKASDDTLKDRIEYRLAVSQAVKKYDIKVKVLNGEATLTGDVATAAQKTEAERLAKIEGVTKLTNALVIDKDEDKTLTDRAKAGLNKTGEAITDTWITTKVKWFFVGEDLLKGSSIDVDTANKVVTLKGTVKTEAGRVRAISLAKETDGVQRVVDQLKIG